MHLRPEKVAETITRLAPRGKLAKRAARTAIRDIVGEHRLGKIKGTATKPTKSNKPA